MYHLIKNPFERKQKGAVSVLCVIFIVLAGSFVSCAQKAVIESDNGGEVSYWICPFDEHSSYIDSVYVKGEAYLFNDSIPDDMKTKIIQDCETSGYAEWIVYEGNNNATLYVTKFKGEGGNNYIICNYPDFAKQWEASLTGQKVYYEGISFLIGGYACAQCPTWYHLGLTVLKKK